MELPNKNVIETLQSRVVTKDEFNYDHLTARPIYSMLTQSDIDEIYRIATSARLSGNPKKRYDLIDQVMHNRGFRKLSAGTNRVAYTYFEDPTIVLKVAADKTAILDNPREFVNQHKLKPFCTKVFEVDPSGTVGLFERVEPITSREEYMTVASDVFEMLDMITSKYVLADIGTKFFMNIGTRKNFGVVLLDFPYLYEINDPNSLVCKKPDINSPGGFCGGLIDYDEGFNTLRCNKCGAIYRAQELGSYLKTNQILMKGNGIKMSAKINISFTRGGKKIELGSSKTDDIMKEESAVIESTPEKKEESNDGFIKVNFRGGNKNYKYTVDPSTPNKDVTTYNFGTRRIDKRLDNVKPHNNNQNQKKAQFARFSKVNDRGNLVFTIMTPNGVQEILVDPTRVPEEFRYIFVPDYQNISDTVRELEQAKADVLKLEDENDRLKVQIHSISTDATATDNKYEATVAELEQAKKNIADITADRDSKILILDNVINENNKLKEQIHELEDKLHETANAINDSGTQKIDELMAANDELEDKVTGLREALDNMKRELVDCQTENDKLREVISDYESTSNTTTSNEATIEINNGTVNEVSDENTESEEEDEEDYEPMTDSIIFTNAVYGKLSDILEYTGRDCELRTEDGTDIDPSSNVVALRSEDGFFLTDNYNNMFLGFNLTPLQFENTESKEK